MKKKSIFDGMIKRKLIDLKLEKRIIGKGKTSEFEYGLKATYEIEDIDKVYKLTISFIPLLLLDCPEVAVKFMSNDESYVLEAIREKDKTQKITIEEIEKALGHSVEIVSSK